MQAKLKGNIGHLAVATDLSKYHYAVFSEIGDTSRVDLIFQKDSKLYTVQVKYVALTRGNKIVVSFKKAGPNYRYVYQSGDVDLFAVYVPDNGKVYYLPLSHLLQNHRTGITLSLGGVSANNQKDTVNPAEDWESLEHALSYLD